LPPNLNMVLQFKKFILFLYTIDLDCYLGNKTLLLSRPLLVAEYQTPKKSVWLVKPALRKLTFCDWAPSVCSEDTTHAVLFRDMVSINYWNVIKIEPFSRKLPVCIFGSIWRTPILGAGMFRFTRLAPGVDKLLSTEYE
jgi:hypothetical protein